MSPLGGSHKGGSCDGGISLFPVGREEFFFLLWVEREVGDHLQARKGALTRSVGNGCLLFKSYITGGIDSKTVLVGGSGYRQKSHGPRPRLPELQTALLEIKRG